MNPLNIFLYFFLCLPAFEILNKWTAIFPVNVLTIPYAFFLPFILRPFCCPVTFPKLTDWQRKWDIVSLSLSHSAYTCLLCWRFFPFKTQWIPLTLICVPLDISKNLLREADVNGNMTFASGLNYRSKIVLLFSRRLMNTSQNFFKKQRKQKGGKNRVNQVDLHVYYYQLL